METRERLLNAGVRLLEQRGQGELSLRRIASEAGVSHGAPRRWFPTYAGLLAAIARSGLEDLDIQLGPALEDDDPARGLRTAAAAYLAFAATRPEMFALVTRHDLLEGAGGHLREITGRWFADLRAALGRAHGTPRAPLEEAVALWSGIQGLATLTSRRAVEAVDPDPVDVGRTLEVLLDRFLRPG